ncbi:MAG: hypothetical protein ACRESL_22155, partial [Pseudomonas sp.]
MRKILLAGVLAFSSTAALAAGEVASEALSDAAGASEPLSLSTPLVGGVTLGETVGVGTAVVGAAAAASNSGGSSNGGTSGTG